MMAAYYNEIDPHAAAWLRELIRAGLIADGEVDERSIADVEARDLTRFDQCHFFAGIGVWSRSLRQAGWPDDRPVWTGSCPCQPWSSAGKRKGAGDERHLWPEFLRLIRECGPCIVLGEQVSSAAVLGRSGQKVERALGGYRGEAQEEDGRPWLGIVQDDLEALGYAVGACDFPAAGVGAPHIRQRLYWVAAAHDRVADALRVGRGGRCLETDADGRREISTREVQAEGHGALCRMAHADLPRSQGRAVLPTGETEEIVARSARLADRPGATDGFWAAPDWVWCRDGKWRPVEPGTFPLANGIAARVGLLRGYGNAICAPQATAFIEVVMEILNASHKTTGRAAGI